MRGQHLATRHGHASSRQRRHDVLRGGDDPGGTRHALDRYTLGDWRKDTLLPPIERVTDSQLVLSCNEDIDTTTLGAIVTVQTLWTAAREEQQPLYRDLLGPERTARNYPFRSLRNAGAMLAAG